MIVYGVSVLTHHLDHIPVVVLMGIVWPQIAKHVLVGIKLFSIFSSSLMLSIIKTEVLKNKLKFVILTPTGSN